MGPMSHQKTGEAMGHKHRRDSTSPYGKIQRINPLVTGRIVPIPQIDALPIRMAQLPTRLPMLRPGVAMTWEH